MTLDQGFDAVGEVLGHDDRRERLQLLAGDELP